MATFMAIELTADNHDAIDISVLITQRSVEGAPIETP